MSEDKKSVQGLRVSWLPDWWFQLQKDREMGKVESMEESFAEFSKKSEEEKQEYLGTPNVYI
mgnify:CR=1 FL=1|nr:hypothetical protein [Nitrosomonas nitrosa]